MRSLSAIGRVAAVGAVIAAIVLVGLILFGGAGVGGYKVKARFLNAGQLVKGNPVQVGGVAGRLRRGHQDHGRRPRRDRALDRRRPRAAPARHARRDPPVLPVRPGEPLRRPEAPAAHRRRDPRRRRDRDRQDRHPGRPRRALQHARPRDPPLAPGLLQGLGRPVARHGRRGERRLRVPEPGAVHLAPALQRADKGHAAPPALPRGQLGDGHGPRRAPRRPRRADRQPEHHDARARQPEGGARRVDRPAPAVHAPRQHDLREPTLDPRRGRPARRGLEAGGEAPRAFPLAGPGLRRRRRADRARPEPHDQAARRRQRPDQPDQHLPGAGRHRHGDEAAHLRAGRTAVLGRRDARRVPGERRGAEGRHRRDRASRARTRPTSSAGSTTSRRPAAASTRSAPPPAAWSRSRRSCTHGLAGLRSSTAAARAPRRRR